ncbi:MAG: hypothetical protein K0U28_08120 [Cyanobacteria bacterium]|nr:hypothetical protein [Cyanobacteriota bacterium]
MSNDYTNKLTYGVSGKTNGMIFYSPREGSHTVPVAGTKLTSVHPARRLVTGKNPATTTVVGVGSNVVANISSINFKVTTGSLQPGFTIQSATLNGIPNTPPPLAMFGGSGYVGTGPFRVVGGSGQGLRITATNAGGVLTNPVVVASGAGYVAGETVTVVGGNQDATITIGSVTTSLVPNSAGAYVAVVESGFAVIVDASGEPLTMASNNGVAPGTTLVVGDALASSFSRWIPRIPARTSPRVLRVTRTAEWVVELGLSSKVTQSFLDSRSADGAQAGNGFDIPIDLEGVTRFTWQEPSQDLRGAGVQGPRASHIQNQAAAIPSLLAVDELYDASNPEQAIATPPIDTDTQSGSVAIVVTAVDPATGIYTLKTSRADNNGVAGNFEYVAGTYNLSFGDVERLVTDITQLTRVPVPGTTPEYDSSGVLTSLHTLEQRRVPGFKPGSIVTDVDDFVAGNQFTLSFGGSADTSLVFPNGTTAADLAQFPVLVYFQRLGAFTSTTMSSLDLSLMSAGRNVTVDVSRGGVFPNYGGSGFLLPHANIFSNYHYLDVGPDTAENARDLFAAIFGQIPMDVERSKMIDFNILQKEGYVINRTADSQRETAVVVGQRFGPVRGVTHVALGNSTGKIQTQTGMSNNNNAPAPHVPTSVANAVIRAPTVNIGTTTGLAPFTDGDYFAPSPLACTSNYVSFSKGLGASSSFIQVRIIVVNNNPPNVEFLAPTGSVVTGTGIDLTQPPYRFPAGFNPGTNQTITAVEETSSQMSGGNLQSSGLSLFTMTLINAAGLAPNSDVIRVASPRNQDFVYLAGLEGEIMYGPGTGNFTYVEPTMFGGNQPEEDTYVTGNRPDRVKEREIYPTSLNEANRTGRTQYRAIVLCEWTPASVPETTGRINFSIVTKGVRA